MGSRITGETPAPQERLSALIGAHQCRAGPVLDGSRRVYFSVSVFPNSSVPSNWNDSLGMITRVQFENFRSHVLSEFSLRPINLLIGAVASGKSNLFKGLLLLQNSVNRSLADMFPPGLGEFQWIRSRWADERAPIGFDIDIQGLRDEPGTTANYVLRIGESATGPFILEETLRRRSPDGRVELIFERRGTQPQEIEDFGPVEPRDSTLLNRAHRGYPAIHMSAPRAIFAKEVARSLNRFGYYHLSAPELKSLGTSQSWDRIGYYGDRLPDFIAWAKSSEGVSPIYEQIHNSMMELLPEIESIVVTNVQSHQHGIAIAFRGQRGYIAAPDLSEGTLLTLGLLSLIHSPRRPALLCVEELDSGLNPQRVRWLFERFVGLAHPHLGNGTEPTQIILSTHSPWLADLFDTMRESVLLVECIGGRSIVTPFVDVLEKNDPGSSTSPDWTKGLFGKL